MWEMCTKIIRLQRTTHVCDPRASAVPMQNSRTAILSLYPCKGEIAAQIYFKVKYKWAMYKFS